MLYFYCLGFFRFFYFYLENQDFQFCPTTITYSLFQDPLGFAGSPGELGSRALFLPYLYACKGNVKGNQANQLILDSRGKFRTKIDPSRRVFDVFQKFRQLRTGNYALSSVGCRNYCFYLELPRNYGGTEELLFFCKLATRRRFVNFFLHK